MRFVPGALGVPLHAYGCGAFSGVSFALPYDVADVVMCLFSVPCMMLCACFRTVGLAHDVRMCLWGPRSVLVGFEPAVSSFEYSASAGS